MKETKEHFYAKANVAGGSPVFLILALALVLLGAVFFIRQASFTPIDGETLTDFVIDEGRGKTGNIKKYFPKPYSVDDLARGDTHQ